MKKFLKLIILPLLDIIKRILTVLKKYCLPDYIPVPPQNFISPYERFVKEEEVNCFNHFKKYFKKSIFIDSQDKIRNYSIKRAIENDSNQEKYYLEFGVHVGISTKLFAKNLNTNIYGFDSFEGLKEDMLGHGIEKGRFNLGGKKPDLGKKVVLIKGWVQDTLPVFLKEKKPKINFVHMDLDTYESTKFVLKEIKTYLSKDSIILFDQIYNFSGWDVGEYKALTEVFNEKEYKFLAFSKLGRQATIQIL